MSEGELSAFMAGKVVMFGNRGAGEEVSNVPQVLVVEITDLSAQEIELAFDVPGTSRRLYLRVPQDKLMRAMTDAE